MAIFHSSDSDGPVRPLDMIRYHVALAIQIGAPAYNSGDHRGCFEVYACTARMLLHSVEGADDEKKLLKQALQRCATQIDVTQQAWTMRHAFDALLGRDSN